MPENLPEFFRKALQEFKAADALLSSKLALHEKTASDTRALATEKAETAERIADGYIGQIEGKPPFLDLSDNFSIAPAIDDQIGTLRDLTIDIKQQEQSLAELESKIVVSRQNLQEALAQEKQARFRRNIGFAMLNQNFVGLKWE